MESPITVDELDASLSATDPAAILLPARLLRRVIRLDRELPGLGLHVPHRKSYVIARDVLRSMISIEEWAPVHRSRLPKTVLLLSRPEERKLAKTTREVALSRMWRLHFHARVDAALGHRDGDRLTRARVRDRIAEIGQVEFDEIRAVLSYEDYLLPPGDDRTTFIEFAAVYLELQRFFSPLVVEYFPSLGDLRRIDAILAEDVDANGIFERTRPAGAIAPHAFATESEIESPEIGAPRPDWTLPALAPKYPSPAAYRWYRARAKAASGRGNDVRAAIMHAAAARVAAPADLPRVRQDAAAALKRLGDRVAAALEEGNDSPAADRWRRTLPALLAPAADGVWSPAARLLYDVQRVCVDHEKDVYVVDFWRWLFSFGRIPLQRKLPYLRDVLQTRHFSRAASRVRKATLPPGPREDLERLLRDALAESESRLRRTFKPILESALTSNGFAPANVPERIALDKLIDELLDRTGERGFLSLGHLRDALSRSQLKLPDLAGPRELLFGDPLLRTDRALGRILDGVYRPGEFYLRWLLRLSALAYGTPVGRFLTLYFVLPFGGAFLLIEGFQHTVLVLIKWLLHIHGHIDLTSPYSVGALGATLFAVLHLPGFGRQLGRDFHLLGSALYQLFVALPIRLLQLPTLQRILFSRTFEVIRRVVVLPAVVTLVFLRVAPFFVRALLHALWPGESIGPVNVEHPFERTVLVFSLALLVFASTLGRRLEDYLADRMLWTLTRIRANVLPGLIRFIAEIFATILEAMERLLYSVDEWLRFRSGDSSLSLGVKAVVGAVWMIVEYVFRSVINLAVEPQINPIKHFPVVTVSHKILIPSAPSIAAFLKPTLGAQAITVTGVILFSAPGVCGFLAWELLSNWRLYAANRPKDLQPVVIGAHGETMIRFLRPAFHSGTLPKLFAKLRRTERKALRTGDSHQGVELRDKVDHVAHSIRDFTTREFLPLLAESAAWQGCIFIVERVTASSNRIRIDIGCRALSGDLLQIGFEEQSGWLVVALERPAWLAAANEQQVEAFRTALAGFYKLAGVDLVREQICTCFPPPPAGAEWQYDVADAGLVLWATDGNDAEAVYDLSGDDAVLRPKIESGFPTALTDLPANCVLLGRQPLQWAEWVALFGRPPSTAAPLEKFKLLPTFETAASQEITLVQRTILQKEPS